MGRKRKDGDPLGLAGTRLTFSHGRFFYIHRAVNKGEKQRWEDFGTDLAAAKAKARVYNDPGNAYGTVGYWLDRFVLDFESLVKAKQKSQRTLDDYRGYCDDEGALKAFFGRMLPEQITPLHVQRYIDEGAKLGRPVPANRERACLSSMLSWLIRTGKTSLVVNPCMRQSGVKRNAESKRERYVTHEEYRAVYAAAPRTVKLMMELVYRTLQRPEVDVLAWTPANLKTKGDKRVLRNVQSKTGTTVDIELTPMLDALIRDAMGQVPVLHQPLVHTRTGEMYSYDGISAMLKRAQDKVRAEHARTGGQLADMPSFGHRDLKGKGATDMWLAGVPIEQIQLLCGHADKGTTERYIKARWRANATPNTVQVLG